MSAVSIRPYQEGDVPELFASVHESLSDLNPWMSWATPAYAISDAEGWVRTTRDGHSTGTMYDFAVVDESGRYVGGCGLNQIKPDSGGANLGYWIRSSAMGRGCAPSAVRLLIDWAFKHTELNRLEIVVAVGNARSLRVAEKVGAHRDAVLKKRLKVAGRPTDAVLYSVVRPDE